MIDNFLLHLNKDILVKWRGHHQINLWFWWQVFHVLNHLFIVLMKLSSVPLVNLGIICSKHHDYNVCFRIQCILISLLIPIRKISIFHHCSAWHSKVQNFKFWFIFKHIHKLRRIRLSFFIWGTYSFRDWISNSNNSFDSFFLWF